MLKKTLFLIFLATQALYLSVVAGEMYIIDGLAPGPISDMFDKYIDSFRCKTGIVIKRVKLEGYGASWSLEKNPEADVVFNNELLSSDLAVSLDTGKPSPYVPVSDIYPQAKDLSWLAGLNIHYGSCDGCKLYAIPFNPSMGIVFYNKTLIEAAGVPLETIPTTWVEIFELSRKLKEKGIVGFTFPWTGAYTLEYCSSLHNIPLTTNNNGFMGKPEFKLHEVCQYRDFIITIFEAVRDGLYHHETDNSPGAEAYFAKNPCAMLMQGSGRMEIIQQTFKKEGKEVAFAYGPLPYDSRFIGSPKSPKMGGTGIWVTQKGSTNPAVKTFLEFVCNPENQAEWSRLSGYMPSTCESDAIILQAPGFYETNLHVKVAAEQARRPVGSLTQVRIPKYDVIRGKVFMKHYVKAIEQVKEGKKPIPEITQEFLKSFSDEANAIIEAAYKP